MCQQCELAKQPLWTLKIEGWRWNHFSWRAKLALYVLAFLLPLEVFTLIILDEVKPEPKINH